MVLFKKYQKNEIKSQHSSVSHFSRTNIFSTSDMTYSYEKWSEDMRQMFEYNVLPLLDSTDIAMLWLTCKDMKRTITEFEGVLPRAGTQAIPFKVRDFIGSYNQLDLLHDLKPVCKMEPDAAEAAAEFGHLDALKWIYLQENGHRCMNDILYVATSFGHLEVIKWTQFRGIPEGLVEGSIINIASRFGHLDIVKWAYAHGTKWGADCTTEAARYGRLNILKFLIANGCEYHAEYITCHAAKSGYLEILQCFLPHELHIMVTGCAARYGHIDILRWAISIGADYHLDSMKFAIEMGHMNIVQYLREAGKQWTSISEDEPHMMITLSNHKRELIEAASRIGNLDMIKYMHANGVFFDSIANVLDIPICYGHLHVIEWMVMELCCSWNPRESQYHAILLCENTVGIKIVQWIEKFIQCHDHTVRFGRVHDAVVSAMQRQQYTNLPPVQWSYGIISSRMPNEGRTSCDSAVAGHGPGTNITLLVD